MNQYPLQRGVVCDPSLDGETHINVYSKGKTELGCALTNMAPIGFSHPKLGWITSLEGYWWYVSTGEIHRDLLKASPFEARRKGVTLKRVKDPLFQDKIKAAILIKLRNLHLWTQPNPKHQVLPLTHYYVYGKEDNCVVRPANNSIWLIDYLESLREVPFTREDNLT